MAESESRPVFHRRFPQGPSFLNSICVTDAAKTLKEDLILFFFPHVSTMPERCTPAKGTTPGWRNGNEGAWRSNMNVRWEFFTSDYPQSGDWASFETTLPFIWQCYLTLFFNRLVDVSCAMWGFAQANPVSAVLLFLVVWGKPTVFGTFNTSQLGK